MNAGAIQPTADATQPAKHLLTVGDVTFNLHTSMLTGSNGEVSVKGRKRDLLKLFIENREAVVTLDMFYAHVYDGERRPESDIFKVFVSLLRVPLGRVSDRVTIKNVPRAGYQLFVEDVRG